jgi:hypothetical protein
MSLMRVLAQFYADELEMQIIVEDCVVDDQARGESISQKP